MDTITPNNSTPSRSAFSSAHRGIWIGGGLMALTIIALATTLVVKSNSSSDTATPLASTPATASTTGTPTDSSSAGQPPVVVAQQSATNPQPVHEAARPVHHTPVHNSNANPNNGNTNANNNGNEPQRVAAVPVCSTCGVIDSYSAVQVQGQANGVGAVAGGLGGALVGSKIAGRSNHTLGGVIGAVGGGLLGNAIEKHERTTTVYDVHVRMNDGSIRTVRQATVPTVGKRVDVDGNTLRAAPDAQG